jgi:hypothetical protein
MGRRIEGLKKEFRGREKFFEALVSYGGNYSKKLPFWGDP